VTDVVWAKLTATNSYGTSVAYSTPGDGATVPVLVPSEPQTLAEDSANTDHTEVTFTWSAPSDNGGAAVADYRVYWDAGAANGSFSMLASGVSASALTYTKTGVTQGYTYVFKVQAQNSAGYSSDSGTVSILAASLPATPSAPTTSVSGSNVVVDWAQPDTHGSAITSYSI
jgi:hypothetical protein